MRTLRLCLVGLQSKKTESYFMRGFQMLQNPGYAHIFGSQMHPGILYIPKSCNVVMGFLGSLHWPSNLPDALTESDRLVPV